MNGDGLGISWGVAFSVAIFAIVFAPDPKRKADPVWEYKYRAEVVRVVDGDTVDAQVDLGFDVKLSARFRLLGINAPEKNTKEGKESLSRLTALLPVGSSVVVQTTKDKKEKYGRYLGTFLVDGKSVNQQLVDEGFAVAKEY
jgi:micrococcal nuclease